MDNIGILVALGAGVLSFVSPCVIPLVPLYLADIAGAAAGGERGRGTFLHCLSFVLGFTAIFVILGAAVGALGSFFSSNTDLLRKISGATLFLFGLALIVGPERIPLLNRQGHLGRVPVGRFRFLYSFLTGATFALGWTPCVGPVLGSILGLALESQTVWRGTYLLAAYSAGLAVPFLFMGAGISRFSKQIGWLNRHRGVVSIVSGGAVVAVGILMFTNTLVRLNSLFNFGF